MPNKIITLPRYSNILCQKVNYLNVNCLNHLHFSHKHTPSKYIRYLAKIFQLTPRFNKNTNLTLYEGKN